MKNKTDIAKINNGSISGVYFADENFNVNDIKSFINYIFSGNGIFILQKSVWGMSLSKLEENYTNILLKKFEKECVVNCNLPKLPIDIYTEIIESFKYVAKQSKNELMCNVYWDKLKKIYILDILEQTVSAVTIEYVMNEEYENNDRFIKYLQIHSHHSMPACFSNTDNDDEKKTTLCYYGVIGKIRENSTIYDVDNKFRIWCGNGFINVPIEFVVDIPTAKPYMLKNVVILDHIIENAKKTTQTKKLVDEYDTVFSETF